MWSAIITIMNLINLLMMVIHGVVFYPPQIVCVCVCVCVCVLSVKNLNLRGISLSIEEFTDWHKYCYSDVSSAMITVMNLIIS